MNRLGHSKNYDFSLELDSALANALQKNKSLLSDLPGILKMIHSDFDNFDQLISSLSGKGSIHISQGIMLVECVDGVWRIPNLPSVPRMKERSFRLEPIPEDDEEIYMTIRKSPYYDVGRWTNTGDPDNDDEKWIDPNCEIVCRKAEKFNIIWFMIRLTLGGEQTVPGWGGFVSLTGSPPPVLTKIDYYPVIDNPITQYDAIKQCLHYSEQTAQEIDQKYVVTTFDLGAAMKAFPLTWNYEMKYKNHIIMVGTFHLTCAYFKAVGKKIMEMDWLISL